MKESVKALVGRKIPNLKELKEFTEGALKDGIVGTFYEVTSEVKLNNKEFKKFTDHFLNDYDWIDPTADCIRVINEDTDEKIIVFPEGYQYARYTALEVD